MTVHIYDTLSGRVKPLEPRDRGRVTLYGCGPTVYNLAHVGNVRTILWYDLIRRYLEFRGYEVTYVMNRWASGRPTSCPARRSTSRTWSRRCRA